MRFKSKVVVITGAVRGIGAGIVRRFAEEGASLALIDLQPTELEEFQRSLGLPAHRVLTGAVDVSDPVVVSNFIDRAAAHFGGIDVLVNNAGIASFGHVTEISVPHWRKVMAVDLDAVFYCSRAAIPHLRKRKGNIVSIASTAGLAADRGLAAYNTAKAGVVNLTRSMAADHGAQGVRVNAVCPGPVRTELTAVFATDPDFSDAFARNIPLGRMAAPEEIAAAVTFLASADASYVTGVALPVDGGVTACTGLVDFDGLFRSKGWIQQFAAGGAHDPVPDPK